MQLTRKFFLQRDQAGTEKCDGSQFLASRFLIFLLGSEQKSSEKSVANISGKKKSWRNRSGNDLGEYLPEKCEQEALVTWSNEKVLPSK